MGISYGSESGTELLVFIAVSVGGVASLEDINKRFACSVVKISSVALHFVAFQTTSATRGSRSGGPRTYITTLFPEQSRQSPTGEQRGREVTARAM